MTPAQNAMPSGACSSITTLASCPCSTSWTPSTIAPHATDPSKASVLRGAEAAKPCLSIIPTGRTSGIKCHHSHSIFQFQRDCHRKKSYIAIADGGYVSASDTEDDLELQRNHAGDLADDGDDE
jgi:hypothetical protein